jgi:hypothetical protein
VVRAAWEKRWQSRRTPKVLGSRGLGKKAALRAGGVCGAGGLGKAVAEPPHSKVGWVAGWLRRLRGAVVDWGLAVTLG